MDNPETMATLDTQDEYKHNTTQKTKDEQHGLHLKQEVNPGVKGK
jgi:hypothetical protein